MNKEIDLFPADWIAETIYTSNHYDIRVVDVWGLSAYSCLLLFGTPVPSRRAEDWNIWASKSDISRHVQSSDSIYIFNSLFDCKSTVPRISCPRDSWRREVRNCSVGIQQKGLMHYAKERLHKNKRDQEVVRASIRPYLCSYICSESYGKSLHIPCAYTTESITFYSFCLYSTLHEHGNAISTWDALEEFQPDLLGCSWVPRRGFRNYCSANVTAF